MRCRIADDSHDVEAINWLLPDGSRRQLARQPEIVADFPPLQQQQLADLQNRHTRELAQARQDGFAEGVRQAGEQAAVEIRGAMDRLATTLNELAQTKRRIRSEAELELLRLSVAIARRILHREIALDEEALSGVVHAALQKLQHREVLRARVGPQSVDSLRLALQRHGAPPALEIVADPSLRTGDLVFETTLGHLDASVETQLQEIGRGLADRLAIRS